jgi:mediator of RNA polymerase II transcription subunit 12
MEAYPENFVSPKTWGTYHKTLEKHISSSSYISIDQRNSRLVVPGAEADQTPRHQIISVLDSSLLRPFSDEIPKKCWHMTNDRPMLVQTVIEWATSSHRPGAAKVYVGARMLRMWSRYGIELNDEILAFLDSGDHRSGVDKSDLYHLISELSRSGHFSTSKYIQWLIARGGIRGPADLEKNGPPSTRLLAELPIHNIPESIDRLRSTLLGRAQISVDDETQQVEDQIDTIKHFMIHLDDQIGTESPNRNVSAMSGVTTVNRSELSRAVKSEIGLWIRSRVSSLMTNVKWANRKDIAPEPPLPMNLGTFNYVRGVLEEIGDLSMLADVLQLVSSLDNVQVLAAATDTLNYNIDSLAAIGALTDLFDKLHSRVRSLAEQRDFDTTILLRSLSDLATRIPGAESVASQLSQEFAQSSRRTAADACSPVSDYMAVLQNPETDFTDEIEKVLASGTSMDTSNFDRLFQMITARIEATWDKIPQQERNCALLLVQLRTFNVKQFDASMSVWLRGTMMTAARPSLIRFIGSLVAADCVDLKTIMNVTAEMLASDRGMANVNISSRIAFEAFALILGTPFEADFMTIDDIYKLSIKRLHVQRDAPTETLATLKRAIEFSAPSMQEEHDDLIRLCQSQTLHHLLQSYILIDLDVVVQTLMRPLGKNLHPDIAVVLKGLTNRLLYPELPSELGIAQDSQTLPERIESALKSADHLTMPFCKLELQVIFTAGKTDDSNGEAEEQECLEAFERAVDLAVMNKNRTWTGIIRTLDIRIARYLCQRAENSFLSIVPSTKLDDSNDAKSETNQKATRLLFLIGATSYSMQTSATQQLASHIVDKLNDIWLIASQGEPHSRQASLEIWLPLMLDFITLHIDMFDSSKNSSEIRTRMLLSLSALMVELQKHNSIESLLQKIFDVAILLVDDLPDDARANCVRTLKDKTADPRIQYIFGYSAPPMDWLQLNQKGKLMPYPLRRWEILSEPTPNVGENDTSLSLTLFQARKM